MLWNWLVYATVFSFVPEHAFPTNVLTLEQSPDLVPCEKGWFYFREKCYRVGGRKYSDRWSWTVAAGRCKAVGGHLVTIESKEELDFIVSFLLLDVKTNVWIGLHDQENESQYSWHDGSEVNYTNWKPSEPSGLKSESEDCVEMLFLPEERNTGTWNDIICTKYNAYICETNTTKRKISPDPTLCTSDNADGWRFQQSCYHIVKEKKSWHSAEEHCKKHFNGGHLVTILDIVVDKFLNYILSDLEEEVWIGISIKEQFQQQWTSGWYVGYDGLSEDKIMSMKGYCIARKKLEEWSLVECSKMLFFVCETSKTMPPVLLTPGHEFHCPEGIDNLRDLGGEFCYFIDTKNYLSCYKAIFECERRGGNLATIHSKEENDILGPFIKYTQYGLYIGLLRSLTQGEEFVWSDGSAMDFDNWNKNEPSNVDEKCAEIYTRTMGWNDVDCDLRKGFICSVRKIGLSSSVLKTSRHKNISQATNVETVDCSGQMSFKALIGVILCITLVLILLGVVIYYFRPWDVERRKKSAAVPSPQPSPRDDRPKYRSQTEFIVKDDDKAYESI